MRELIFLLTALLTSVAVAVAGTAWAYDYPADAQIKNDCKNNGWQNYGFDNRGQCIRFVNTGKDSRS